MDAIHFGSDAVIWLGIAAICFFLKDLHKTNKEQHIETRKAVERISLLIKSDAEILELVNGKYISRREADAWEKNRVEIVARMDKELERERDHWHDEVVPILQNIKIQLPGIPGMTR